MNGDYDGYFYDPGYEEPRILQCSCGEVYDEGDGCPACASFEQCIPPDPEPAPVPRQAQYRRQCRAALEGRSYRFEPAGRGWLCTSKSGRTYKLAADGAWCECPDSQRHGGTVACKHRLELDRRLRSGELIPPSVDRRAALLAEAAAMESDLDLYDPSEHDWLLAKAAALRAEAATCAA